MGLHLETTFFHARCNGKAAIMYLTHMRAYKGLIWSPDIPFETLPYLRWRSLPLVTKLTFERMLSFLFWIAVGTFNFFDKATSPEKMGPF